MATNYESYAEAVANLLDEVSILRYKQAVLEVVEQLEATDLAEESRQAIYDAAASLLREANEQLEVIQQTRVQLRAAMSEAAGKVYDCTLSRLVQNMEVPQ